MQTSVAMTSAMPTQSSRGQSACDRMRPSARRSGVPGSGSRTSTIRAIAIVPSPTALQIPHARRGRGDISFRKAQTATPGGAVAGRARCREPDGGVARAFASRSRSACFVCEVIEWDVVLYTTASSDGSDEVLRLGRVVASEKGTYMVEPLVEQVGCLRA